MAANTALIEVHKELGAKMAPFGSWNLPVFYPGGAVAEHRHCRKNAGLLDLGDRIIARIAGDVTVLDKNLTTPLSSMAPETGTYCLWLKPDGTIAADLTVCRMGENDFLASFGHGVTAAMVTALASALPSAVQMQQLTGALSSFMLLGKAADEVMAGCSDENLPETWQWKKLTFRDDDEEFRAIVLKRELFGETAWEFIFNAEFAADLYEIFYRNVTVEPVGMTAFESLRVESLTGAFSSEYAGRKPAECGWAGSDGNVKMIAAEMARHPAKAGADICDCSGNKIGTVTSGAFCPSDDCAKIIGFVNADVDICAGMELMFGDIAGKII